MRSAGSGAQKFFRYDLFFSLPPGGAGKKEGGQKTARAVILKRGGEKFFEQFLKVANYGKFFVL